jgi:hypothetical protein
LAACPAGSTPIELSRIKWGFIIKYTVTATTELAILMAPSQSCRDILPPPAVKKTDPSTFLSIPRL